MVSERAINLMEMKIRLMEMQTRVEKIEQLALELSELGREVPAVQKNCRTIMSATYNLKFGISDVADISKA